MADSQNAYDIFLQNYVMYGMSDPNGLYTGQNQQSYQGYGMYYLLYYHAHNKAS